MLVGMIGTMWLVTFLRGTLGLNEVLSFSITIGLVVVLLIVGFTISNRSNNFEFEEVQREIISQESILVNIVDKYEDTYTSLLPLGKVILPRTSTIYILVYEYKGVKFEKEVSGVIYDRVDKGSTLEATKTELKSNSGSIETNIEISYPEFNKI